MKNCNIFILALGIVIVSCQEEHIGQHPTDNIPPDPVSNVEIIEIPGGCEITYDLPEDEDLLYVEALFSREKGINSEARASYYKNILKLEGFGDTLEHQVELRAVDRSGNKSESTIETFSPLTPPVITIGQTLSMSEGFGGVKFFWQNPTRAEVGIVVLEEDNNGEFVPIETYYSTMIDGSGSIRGLDTIPFNFGIYVKDRWENKSELKYFELTPLFEEEMDKNLFREVKLPGDAPDAWGWVMPRMWDGIIDWGNGFNTADDASTWPHSWTFDIGNIISISRLKIWQRPGSHTFNFSNLRKFEVWGCVELDPTGNWDTWTKLGSFESIKPSGLPLGQLSDEDRALVAEGEDYEFPDAPRVRYIRFRALETWANTRSAILSELAVYGAVVD